MGVTMKALQPDFIQNGDMQVIALKQNNPKDDVYLGIPAIIYANPPTTLDQITNLKETAKIIQLQFSSNVIGGNYQMGQTMIDIVQDGERDT